MKRVLHTFLRSGLFVFVLLLGYKAQAQHIYIHSVTKNLCANGEYDFTDGSLYEGKKIASQTWRLPNGSTTSFTGDTAKGIAYLNAGNDTIFLTDSFTNGTKFTNDTIITILAIAKAGFLAPSVCDDSTVTFTNTTNTSTTTVSSYLWDFGDSGATSNAVTPPPHHYLGPNKFPVTLTATSSTGCVSVLNQTVTLYETPYLDTLTMKNTCMGAAGQAGLYVHYFVNQKYSQTDTVIFYFNTAKPATGDTMVIINNYNKKLPAFYKGLETNSQLIGVIRLDSTVYTTTWFDPKDTTKADTLNGSYIDSISVDSTVYYNDTITNAQSGSFYHFYNDTGSYNVHIHIKSTTGCVYDMNKTVLITPIPVANFSFTPGCRSTGNLFTDLSTVSHPSHISMVVFDYGDSTGSPGHKVLAPFDTVYAPFAGKFPHKHFFPQSDTFSIYNVTEYAFSETGCEDNITQKVNVFPTAQNDFQITNISKGGQGCPNFGINFQDASTMTDPTVAQAVSYKWDFGDPTSGIHNTDTGLTVTHVYNNPGTYTVKHIVTTSGGCIDTTSKSLTIIPRSKPGIIAPASVCSEALPDSNLAYFQDKSTPPAGYSISSYYWNFGDSNSGALNIDPRKDPFHAFSGGGTFTITHVVFTNAGCSDTTTTTLKVTASPTAYFNPAPVCLGQTTQFTDASVANAGAITGYFWDFGDGSATTTAKNTSHLYAKANSYTVTHAVSSSTGCTDTFKYVVTVYGPPVAYFTYDMDVCAFYGVATFFDTSQGGATKITWYFGDGDSSAGANANHTYAKPGTYTVTDIAATNTGCTDVATHTITVHDRPHPYMRRPGSDCEKKPVQFFDSTQYAAGKFYQLIWNFGDGTANDTVHKNPTHIYANASTYYPLLIAIDSPFGCRDTFSDSIHILPGPTPVFSDLNGTFEVCVNNPINFFNTSSIDPAYTIAGYVWLFGDGSTSTSANSVVSHSYANVGTDTVRLIAISNLGCSDTTYNIVTVDALPKPYFITSPQHCSGYPINIEGKDNTGTDDYTWTIEGTLNYATNFQYTFNNPGLVPVHVVATNQKTTCSYTLDTTISVFASPTPNFTVPSVCQGQPSVFTDASTISYKGLGDSIIQWAWITDDSLDNTADTLPTLIHTFLYAGAHSVQLTVTTNHGCQESIIKKVQVNVKPVARIVYRPNPLTITNPKVVFYDSSANSSSTVGNYKNYWNLGDGYIRTDSATITHVYDTPGVYIVTLAVQNTDGCADTVRDSVLVQQVFTMFIPDAFTPNGDGVNDVWKPVSEGVLTYELQILNIWGGEMFRTTDPTAAWKGDYEGNGKIAPDGMYIYRIVCTDVYNQVIHTFKGNITLIK